MSMNSVVADCIARIKNALRARHNTVKVFYSKMIIGILGVLRDEGYIEAYRVLNVRDGIAMVEIDLKFYHGHSVIKDLQLVSKPGCRTYSGVRNITKVCDGLGIVILSTSRGIVSDVKARALGVGGEMICRVM